MPKPYISPTVVFGDADTIRYLKTAMVKKALFVCLGNICRSPLAEGTFRYFVEQAGLSDSFSVDSAGTASYHVGQRPHHGARRVAALHDISLDGQSARQVTKSDFEKFDWLIAMDQSNADQLIRLHADAKDKVHLLLAFSKTSEKDVHDPYYDGDFERTFSQVESGCKGLFHFLNNQA